MMYDFHRAMCKVQFKNYGRTGKEIFRTKQNNYIGKICEIHY